MANDKIKQLKLQVKKFIVFRNREIMEGLKKMRKQTAVTSTRKKQTAVYLAAYKRSRGGAEQRAMFAKMGASGSLQGKGPDGKRTGPKIGDKDVSRRLNEAKKISDKIRKIKKRISNPTKDDIPAALKIELNKLSGQLRGIINSPELTRNQSRELSSKLTSYTLSRKQHAYKRSRGGAEQRAMFAKMGASGSLQGKGPSGKRTGGKLPAKESKQAKIDTKNMNSITSYVSRSSELRDRLARDGFKLSGHTPKPGRAGSVYGEVDSVYQGPSGKKFIIRSKRGARTGETVYTTEEYTEKQAPALTVYKDKNGRLRWVSISSNAFKDRDGEIVSTRALKDAVKKADSHYKKLITSGETREQANLKARGPLRWWHIPGLDFGVCDFQAVNGRMLIESGYFNDEKIAKKMAKGKNLNISIGFRHPSTEPDKDGIFNIISIFERSATPQGRAANRFTSLSVKGAKRMTEEKIKALRLLLGDDADHILEMADTTQKGAETAGVAYKATDAPTIAELMEIYEAYKAAEAELSDDSAAELWDEIEYDYEEETEKMDHSKKMPDMEEMKAGMVRIEESLKNLAALLGGKREEEKKKEAHTLSRIAELEEEIARLKGEAPTATRGYRATFDSDPIEPTQEDWNAQREKALNAMGPAGQLLPAAEQLANGLFKQ